MFVRAVGECARAPAQRYGDRVAIKHGNAACVFGGKFKPEDRSSDLKQIFVPGLIVRLLDKQYTVVAMFWNGRIVNKTQRKKKKQTKSASGNNEDEDDVEYVLRRPRLLLLDNGSISKSFYGEVRALRHCHIPHVPYCCVFGVRIFASVNVRSRK